MPGQFFLSEPQVALMVKNPPANAGGIKDVGSILGLERFPGGGYGNFFQCSRLENPRAEEYGLL